MIVRHALIALLILLAGLSATPVQAELQAPRNVLYFGSFQPTYYWDEEVTTAIGDVFRSADMPINYLTEFIDVRHNPTPNRSEVFSLLFELYKKKYRDIPLDAIIVSYNDALDFLITYRKKLFPGVPVIICGIASYDRGMLKGEKNITGTVDYRSAKTMIDLALSIHPNTRHVAVVVDDSIYAKMALDEVTAIAPSYRPRVDFIPLVHPKHDNLMEALRKLPDHTVILETSFHSSPSTDLFTSRKEKSIVYEVTGLPIYSVWDKAVGNGAVAGQAVHPVDHGRGAALAALKVLKGTSADDIGILTIPSRTFLFDNALMERFGISKRKLPENVILINEPQTFYYRYRQILLTSGMIIGGLLITILVLVLILQKKRMEKRNLVQTVAARERENRLAEELRQAQKLEALGTFSGGIAHDLNNIFGVIDSCSRLALEEAPDESVLSQDLSQISQATRRGKDLVQRITSFAKRSEHKHEPLCFPDLFHECVAMLEARFGSCIDIQTEVEDPGIHVSGDPGELHQVIMNIGVNACQAMVEGGTLTLRVSGDKKGDVCLTAQDTGHGMAPEILSRIFDPFFTTKKGSGGVGLGLSTAHGIVQNHGGKLSATSIEGKGTTFTLTLPTCVKEARVTQNLSNAKILILDDDEGMLYSLSQLLKRQGHEVITTTNPDEAKEIALSPKPPALLLFDEMMGSDKGSETLNCIRESGCTTPAIICSGYIGEEENAFFDTLHRLKAHFVPKPLNHAHLLHQVKACLSSAEVS